MHTMSTSRPDGGPAGAAGGRIGRRWGGTVQASNRSAPRAPRRPIPAELTQQPAALDNRWWRHAHHVDLQARRGSRGRRGWANWTPVGLFRLTNSAAPPGRPPAARSRPGSPTCPPARCVRRAAREGGIGSTQARGAFLREAAARARRPWAGAPLRAPPLRPAGPRRPRRRSHPPCTSAAPSVHTPSQDPSSPPDPPRLSRAVRCAALDAPGRGRPCAPHRFAPRAPAGRGGGPTPPARAPRRACTPPHRTRPVRPTRRGFPARCGAPRWMPVRKGCLARPRPTARRAPPPTRERLAPCTPV